MKYLLVIITVSYIVMDKLCENSTEEYWCENKKIYDFAEFRKITETIINCPCILTF